MKAILNAISGEDARHILMHLCAADPKIKKMILAEAERILTSVDPEEVAENLFGELDCIDVEDLWNRSGRNRYGYSAPDEMAVEMVEEVLAPFTAQIKQYRDMDMPEPAKQYCMGVLLGLYRFEQEGSSEFKDYAVDVAGECFSAILEEFSKNCPRKRDVEDITRFIAANCPKWASGP